MRAVPTRRVMRKRVMRKPETEEMRDGGRAVVLAVRDAAAEVGRSRERVSQHEPRRPHQDEREGCPDE